jgi:ribosomal protein S18 acetylase RimI-like enzyme
MLEIRQATIDDISALARVHVQSWHETYTGLMPQSVLDGITVEAREAQWIRTLSNERMRVFVAELDGAVVGFTSFCTRASEDHAELFTIYVLKAHHGQAIGKELWETVLVFLAVQNIKKLVLWVLENNPTRGFYEHFGGIASERKLETIQDAQIIEVMYSFDLN